MTLIRSLIRRVLPSKKESSDDIYYVMADIHFFNEKKVFVFFTLTPSLFTVTG